MAIRQPYPDFPQPPGAPGGPTPKPVAAPAAPTPAASTPGGPAPTGPSPAPAAAPAPAGVSGSAQRYFNQFSPDEQSKIRASWNGQDMMEEWYQNALKAGATNETGAMAPGTGVGTQQGGEHSGQDTIIVDPSKSLREQGIASQIGEEGWSQQGMPDRTGMRAWSRENGMSEDYDRYDENQMVRWMKSFDKNCPPKTPFRADDGSGCVEKPIDSNRQGGVGGPGGGAAGGAGGPGDVSAWPGLGGAGALDAELLAGIRGMINGTGTRYTPEAMQGLLASIKQQMEGSKARQLGAASRDAASRGISRAGATTARLADIRRGAEAGFTSEYANVLKSKIDADYQDKVAGLDRAQKYLDSLRDNLYRNDLTAMQREQFKANLALAYANIRNQREMLTAQAGYGMLRGGV